MTSTAENNLIDVKGTMLMYISGATNVGLHNDLLRYHTRLQSQIITVCTFGNGIITCHKHAIPYGQRMQLVRAINEAIPKHTHYKREPRVNREAYVMLREIVSILGDAEDCKLHYHIECCRTALRAISVYANEVFAVYGV